MSKQRMAGYTPFQGAPWQPASSGPETPLTTTPAAPAAVGSPEAGVPSVTPAVTESTASVPLAEVPTAGAADPVPVPESTPVAAPVVGVPYEQRQRMAGYTPFRGAAPLAPASAPPASVAPAASEAAAASGGAHAAPTAARSVVAATRAEAPADAAAPVPAQQAASTAKVGQRMKGYTPLKRSVEAPPAAVAAPAVASAPPAVAGQRSAQTSAAAVAETPTPASAPTAAQPAAAAAAPAPQAPDTRSAPPASSVPSPTAARDGRATTKTAAAEADGEKPWWRRLLWPVLGVVLTGLVLVLAARWLRTLDPVADFIAQYPGEPALPEGAPVGLPPWLGWQHFLNMFLMVLIIRTGLQIRAEQRPPANFTPKEKGLFLAPGNTPKKYSLTIWTHMALDALWLLNGLIFVVLLFATGQWARIVPTDPAVLQHALSTGIQYLSLDWPPENGWSHYNALQMISYTLVVFVAAPLSALTGWRMSSWFPASSGLAKAFPMETARKLHFPVMVFFVLFIVAHVFLVLFTGVLHNLNYMYTSRDAGDWWGLLVFLVSLAVVAAGWFFLKPAFTAPVAEKFGTVGR